jgi:signal recognition particle subunit SRP54
MGDLKDQIRDIDDRELDQVQAIILSMTPAERTDVKILNASRRTRIARGSGTQVSDVNQLVNRFLEARKMMSSMARGGMPGLPGMGGMPGMPGPGKRAKAGKGKNKKAGKARSGNPAKRAQQEQQEQQRLTAQPATTAADLQLPPEFTQLLPPGST